MTDSDPTPAAPTGPTPGRAALENDITLEIRALSVVSEQLGHVFARDSSLRPNDFRALLHIAAAESAGRPLTPGQLGKLTGMTSPAVTYLVDRLIESGHLRRVLDPDDRRRVILYRDALGSQAAQDFFTPVGESARAAMAEFPVEDLAATHRVLAAVTMALREHYDTLTDRA
ncbi:MarR family winged helix-turn-helix transcriptional regulator [Nocardia sp. NPDC059240]|uniref:MarR family winged helix-turn-helix transcriptional regulator n=1 Tax=Nocardia sp. NPDC059240 TaxID=3346786 RepID=UPI00367A0CE9